MRDHLNFLEFHIGISNWIFGLEFRTGISKAGMCLVSFLLCLCKRGRRVSHTYCIPCVLGGDGLRPTSPSTFYVLPAFCTIVLLCTIIAFCIIASLCIIIALGTFLLLASYAAFEVICIFLASGK